MEIFLKAKNIFKMLKNASKDVVYLKILLKGSFYLHLFLAI